MIIKRYANTLNISYPVNCAANHFTNFADIQFQIVIILSNTLRF